ncbi:MAG: hypothetical protein ABI584_01330 [Acidobacteriota bacterium]
MRRPRRALALLAAGAVFAAPLLLGATPRIAVTAGARDFLAGDAKGVAVSADGRLTLGAAFAARAWPDDAADAAVFAAAADGSGHVFVATGGGLGRLFVSSGAGVKLLFTAPEPNVTAVAVASDGAVFCGTSPNGKIYRVDPKAADAARSATVVGDPKEAAIWALAFAKDGTLYAGTGNKGRIYRKTSSGALELFHEVEDVHIRTLAAGPDGTVYAGTSDRGLVIAFPVQGGPRTLHDFSRPEVTGLAVDARGVLYAAASQLDPSAGRPAPTDLRLRPVPTPTPPPGGAEEAPRGSVSVSASTSPLRPAVELHAASSSEIAVIQPDGFVEPGWLFPEESILGLRLEANGALLVATGSKGRVYEWKDRRVRLVASTGEKLALAVPAVGSGYAVVTMGAAGILRPEAGVLASGTFTSPVKDASRLSTFGRLRFEGQVPAGAALSLFVRAGNSDKPDATWSAWLPVGADGGAKPPAARFFQWKAEMKASAKGESPVLERIDLSYAERNARPVLENLALLEPGAVFSRGATGAGVLSVANPDESGIYSGLEVPREGAGGDGPGKRLFRKGYRTLTWKGTDPNGDTLRYEVEGRREEGATWFPVRKDLEDSYLSFDTTALADGRYRFRVTASDRLSQPESEALTAREETGVVLIDNTPPVLKVESKKVEGDVVVVTVLATDALSPVTKGEGAVNADRWRLLPAEDGAADSPVERFVFRIPKPPGPAVLSVRVLDATGNVAAISVDWPF